MVQVGGVGDRTNNLWNDSIVTFPVSKVTRTNNLYVIDKIGESANEIIAMPFTLNGNKTCNLSFDAYADEDNTKIVIDGFPDSIYAVAGITDKVVILSTTNTRYNIPLQLLNGNTSVRFYRTSSTTNANTSKIYLSNIQLEEGSTMTDYEPYGYKVPIVCGETTTNIYLDKPIEAKANIPSEYTEVEYLGSTGTQYIDTGIVLNSDSGFKTKIVFTGHTNGVDDFLIGVRSNSTYGRFAYTCTSNTFYCSLGSTTSSLYRYNANMPSTEIIECELNYKNSNTTITQGVEGLLSDKNRFDGEGLSFYLAGAYNAKGIPKYKAMRQYKCELTQGTQVVRDLVPCYRNSDNVAGLYDLVNNTFYTNQGTGNFIVGPIKENESISLSDTNTNIPTIRGTNVLTVDTTVQPSKVYVKSRKESQYEIALRQYYESIINS